MENKKRASWSNRLTFILAAVGSAVGLGNAWRFPGLAAKHGGGAFMLVYILALIVMGIPLLMMEISIGRKMRRGAPESMRGLNKKLEPIGWAATTNAYLIAIYYAVVFAWVIMMAILSFKFANFTGDPVGASKIWSTAINTTGNFSGFDTISSLVLVCLLLAWIFIFVCIRNGAQSVSKVVKFTVFAPVVCLVIMAVKGITMSGAFEGLKQLFVPDFSKLSDPNLWVDAFGQVFYSLSIMMAIMFAYGSFLKDEANIAVDSIIIALSDFLTSVLSSIVLFTTMYGVGNTIDDMSASGISTAFIIYPQSIVCLTDSGVFNAIFAFIFYFCLCTLAIDSAFSIIEGVSTAVSDKFKLKRTKTTLICCIIAGIISISMTTGAGLAILDVVDNWCNSYNLVIVGIFECIAVGWCFKTTKVLDEVNRNTVKFKMPKWWFITSIKYLSPVLLTAFFVWNVVTLFINGGIYGAADGYTLTSNVICGWLLTAITVASGFIVKLIVNRLKKNGFTENNMTWDEPEVEKDVEQ